MTDAAEQSRIILNPDRTITVVMDDLRRVELKPPTIGQFRQIRNRYAEADVAYKAGINDLVIEKAVVGEEHLLAIDSDGVLVGEEASPYAAAFATTIGLLGGVIEPDPDSLPVWAGRGGVYAIAAAHWRYVQVVPVNQPETAIQAEQVQPHFDPPEPAPTPVPPVVPALVMPDGSTPEPRFPDPDLAAPAEHDGMAPGRVAAR